MVGIPGSGKSAFAEHFAKTFGAPIVNGDALKRSLSLNDAQAAKAQKLLLTELLKTRRTLVIETATHKKIQRTALVNAVTKAGLKPLIVWVQTDPAEAKRRATKPFPQGSGMTSDRFTALSHAFEPPTPFEKPLVISGKHTYATQLKVVLKQLASEPRIETSQPAGRPEKPASRSRGIAVR